MEYIFVIQCEPQKAPYHLPQIIDDFGFAIYHAAKEQNWLNEAKGISPYKIELVDDMDFLDVDLDSYDENKSQMFIPIGSIEFVTKWAQTHEKIHPLDVQSINIPETLRQDIFLGRDIQTGLSKTEVLMIDYPS